MYTDIQSGSLMGVMHASVGYEVLGRHHVMLGLGYVPELDEHHEMGLASVRYRYENPFQWHINVADTEWRVKPFNFGVGFLYSDHSSLFIELPEQYPGGYYTPTALRMVFNYQLVVQASPKLELYLDFSMIDIALISYIREPDYFYDNYDYLGLDGVANWGLGLRYSIGGVL